MNYSGRILILDDEIDIINMLADLLNEEFKDRVDKFSNPHEALYAFDKKDYFLILLDFKMPGMNGLEFCREMAKKNSNVRFILISGCLDPSIEDEAKSLGVEECISKPINTVKLIEKIKHIHKLRIVEFEVEIELRTGFLEEMIDNFGEIDNLILECEQPDHGLECVSKLFRFFHNLKGGGAAVGFKKLSAFAHQVENKLNLIREGKISMNNEMINFMLAATDVIKNALNALKANPSIESEDLYLKDKSNFIEKEKSMNTDSKEIVEVVINKDLVLTNIKDIMTEYDFSRNGEYNIKLDIHNIDTSGIQYLISLTKLPNRFISFKCNDEKVLNNLKTLGFERFFS